jgi:two-component system, OmpR family, response regulator VicR
VKKRVLTTGEVADYCGVNFRTVIRWIKRGQLDAYQLPGRGDNRIEVDDFIDFLITHKMPVPDELQSVLANKESTPTPSEKEQRIKSGDTVDIKPQEKLRVLIVDDDLSSARAIERTLERAGFETEIAMDGFSAGALMQMFAPSVMTLDLMMPGLGGFEVLKFMREDSSDIRILVISGMPAPQLEKALDEGADDTMAKPYDSKVLVDKVSQLALR